MANSVQVGEVIISLKVAPATFLAAWNCIYRLYYPLLPVDSSGILCR